MGGQMPSTQPPKRASPSQTHARASRLQLRASPSAPARDDVHEHDQRYDDHRSNGDDGNGGRSDDHPGRPIRPYESKNLGGDWNCSRPCEFHCELTEDGEVGVEADALDATDAEHRQRVAMLPPAELALDG